LVVFSSCIQPKKIVYMNDLGDSKINLQGKVIEPTIKVGDQLYIYVSSMDMQATMVYNAPNFASPRQNASSIGNSEATILNGYLVDTNGNIALPEIGQIKAAGQTYSSLKTELESRLNEYLKNPIVSIRCLNYRITVLGEVKASGTYNIPYQRINILQALGIAGDLTIQGNRKNVLVIRETSDERIIQRLDLTDPKILEHPFYMLDSGDVIYVEPNQSRINSASTFLQIWPTVASAITLLILAINLR
jgi:polysaccharide export outer membrane protein